METTKATFNPEENKYLLYKMTKADGALSMSKCGGDVFRVREYVEYDDVDHKGNPVHLLSILCDDEKVRTTQSNTFMERFYEIEEMLGFSDTTLKVTTGTTKSDKLYVTCTIE